MSDEIQWGDDAPPSLLGRITSAEPAPGKSRLVLNYWALGVAVAGFLAVLAGQYLPWATLPVTAQGGFDAGSGETEVQPGRTVELTVGSISSWQVTAIEIGVLLALSLVAAALFSPAAARRVCTGAAIGLLAAELALLVGLSGMITSTTGGLGSMYGGISDSGADVDLGSGLILSAVAQLVLAAALVLNLRDARPRRTKEMSLAAEPIDLEVTAVPGRTVDIRSEPGPSGG